MIGVALCGFFSRWQAATSGSGQDYWRHIDVHDVLIQGDRPFIRALQPDILLPCLQMRGVGKGLVTLLMKTCIRKGASGCVVFAPRERVRPLKHVHVGLGFVLIQSFWQLRP